MKSGRLEDWVEGWKGGRMEDWKDGRLEGWKDGSRSPVHPSFQSSTLPFPTIIMADIIIDHSDGKRR
jgi:hypothetical protein